MQNVTVPAAGQLWSADDYAKHGRFVAAELGKDIFTTLNPKALERILDLGCGDGYLTEKIAASGAIVTGVDADERMVEATQRRGLPACVADARKLPYENEFDAVFSNAALHWVKESDAVLRSIYNALKPHGRFVAEFGGFGNIAALRTAICSVLKPHGREERLINRWYFPSADEYSKKCQAVGFEVKSIHLVPRPVQLSTDMMGWLTTFTGGLFDGLPPSQVEKALNDAKEILEPILKDHNGMWWADYVRLRVVAHKPK